MKIHNIIILSFLWTLLSCGSEQQTLVERNEGQDEIVKKDRLFMRTIYPYLRIRATPDREGAVLETLLDDALLEYLHDSTTFQTELRHRGDDYAASWYKVRTHKRKNEGWIFGAFVTWVPYLENKELSKEADAEEALAAANQGGTGMTKAEQAEKKQPVQTSLVESYRFFLNNLDASNPYSMGKALDYFRTRFIGQNMKTCDAAYVELNQFHDKAAALLNQRGVGKYQSLKEEVMRYGRATMLIDTFARSLGNNAFNFGVENGKVIVVKDVDFVFRLVYRECSSIMRAYMGQVETDASVVWLDEEKLLINPLELTRWVLTWNYFVATHTDFALYEDAKSRLRNQLTILLQGVAKTPAFDESNTLKESFKEAYLHITKNYPDSKIGQAFQKYIEVLESSNWKNSSLVKQEQSQLLEQLVGA